MASTRIASPLRGVTHQLGRLSIRQATRQGTVTATASQKSLSTSFARPITTSTSSQAAISTIITSTENHNFIKPLEEQTVLATIHKFPSLEPFRLESFPANHLYLPTRKDILHRAVVYEGDMTRLGTASTKTRYEVRGSARKIRPQKGSGRARLGDKKSPILKGGGVAHGPKPRDFSTGLQKKVYDLAWRTALSYRFRKGELIIVDNAIEIESPSQRLLNHIFDLHDRERGHGRSLLVTLENRPLLEQALDKMDRRRQALTWQEVDVKDLLELSRIIIERSALHNILLAHQEDLTHTPTPAPWHRSFVKSAPPEHLESVPGWSEFSALMQTPLSEREAFRPDAYESVAYSRWKHAETLPEGPEKLSLTISAYELLAEAKDLRRENLPRAEPLEAKHAEKEELIADLRDRKAAAIAQVESSEVAVRLNDLEHQRLVLSAQAAEHRADAYRWRGDHALADEEYEKARDFRTDVANAELNLYSYKKDLALARAEVSRHKGSEKDIEEANAQLAIAKQMEEAAEKFQAEIDATDAEDEAEERLEMEEQVGAEGESQKRAKS